MKASLRTLGKRNLWKIPAGLLGLAVLVLWTTPAQACSCSSKAAKPGAAGGCGSCKSTGQSGDACGCGSKGGSRTMKKGPAGNAKKGAQKAQPELPEYAKKAKAAIEQGDMAAAEAILEAQYMQRKTADEKQAKLAVATGLARLASRMHGKDGVEMRKNMMDRALALTDETIGSETGSVKATALIVKARILKQNKADEAEVQALVDTAREIDPENAGLRSFSKQNQKPPRS